jgi:hypothetical protein
MNPKIILCLALVLSGGLVGCSHAPIYQTRNTHDAILRVVVKPEKMQVRIGEHFNLALRVENPTTTNQYVRVETCGWPSEWRISNPRIIGPCTTCEFNPLITEEIPAGGSIKFDLEVSVPWPISIEHSTGKLSFQMGFMPIGSKQTFWSKEMTIKVIP